MFVLSIIVFLIALVPLLLGKRTVDGGTINFRLFGVPLLVLSFLFLGLASITNVPANAAGVIRTGGAVADRTLDGGYHLKAPWQSVNDIDGTERTERYHGDSCISVALGDRSETCMSVSVRWKINIDKANEIYKTYRNEDDPVQAFRDAVVSPQIIAASVDIAQTYNPLSQLKSIDPQKLDKGFEFTVDYEALSDEISKRVVEATQGKADILDISVTKLPLSEASQNRVNTFIASISDTLIAQQKVKTAEQEALANEKLAESLKANPSVNVANCIKAVQESAPGTFPAGFQCQSGANGSVVIPSK